VPALIGRARRDLASARRSATLTTASERTSPRRRASRSFQRASERYFNAVIDRYAGRSAGFLAHQTATLVVAGATLVATILLYVVVPKDSSRYRHGRDPGVSEAPRPSFVAMRGAAGAHEGHLQAPPSDAPRSSASTASTRRRTVGASDHAEAARARRVTAMDVRRLQPAPLGPGVTLFMQPVRI